MPIKIEIGILIVDVHGYFQIGDDIKHSIQHIGNRPLQSAYDTRNYLFDVLHVPTITENLIFVGQVVEWGLQIRFTHRGCFVEDRSKGFKLIAKEDKEGRLFTMDVDSSNPFHMITKNCKNRFMA